MSEPLFYDAQSVAARAEASHPGVPCPILAADAEVRLGDLSARLALAEGADFPVLQLRNDTASARPVDHLFVKGRRCGTPRTSAHSTSR